MKNTILSLMSFILCAFLFSVNCYANEEPTYDQYSEEEIVEAWESEVLSIANTETVIGDWKSTTRSAYGAWSWRDGIICVTDSYASSPLFNNGHAGIIAAAPYYYATIEANPSDGVQVKYGDWTTRYGSNMVYQYGVIPTTETQDQLAAIWTANQLRKPYNSSFLSVSRRDAFYCSQLVWAAYKDTTGIDISTTAWGVAVHPFELMNSSLTALIYRNR